MNEATTVHTTITGAISISDVFADIGTAESGNTDAITVDFVITEQSGDAVAGLVAGNFATDFITGGLGDIAIVIDDEGSGGYRLTITPTDPWVDGRTDIVLTATSGALSATTLLVVDLD